MALARLDIPGLVLYNGSIAPGRYKGRDVTIQDVFEVVGAHAAGHGSAAEEVHALESVACPGAGACGGQFTANTMSMALDILGHQPGRAQRRARACTRTRRPRPSRRASWSMRLVRDDVRPSQIITRDADRERHRRRRRQRRLDQRRAAPARDRLGDRHRARRSTTSTRSPTARRSSPASPRAASTSPPTCTRPAASPSSPASCVKRGLSTPARATSTAARSARSPTTPTRPPGQQVVAARSRTRSRRPAASRSCAATSRPRDAW